MRAFFCDIEPEDLDEGFDVNGDLATEGKGE